MASRKDPYTEASKKKKTTKKKLDSNRHAKSSKSSKAPTKDHVRWKSGGHSGWVKKGQTAEQYKKWAEKQPGGLTESRKAKLQYITDGGAKEGSKKPAAKTESKASGKPTKQGHTYQGPGSKQQRAAKKTSADAHKKIAKEAKAAAPKKDTSTKKPIDSKQAEAAKKSPAPAKKAPAPKKETKPQREAKKTSEEAHKKIAKEAEAAKKKEAPAKEAAPAKEEAPKKEKTPAKEEAPAPEATPEKKEEAPKKEAKESTGLSPEEAERRAHQAQMAAQLQAIKDEEKYNEVFGAPTIEAQYQGDGWGAGLTKGGFGDYTANVNKDLGGGWNVGAELGQGHGGVNVTKSFGGRPTPAPIYDPSANQAMGALAQAEAARAAQMGAQPAPLGYDPTDPLANLYATHGRADGGYMGYSDGTSGSDKFNAWLAANPPKAVPQAPAPLAAAAQAVTPYMPAPAPQSAHQTPTPGQGGRYRGYSWGGLIGGGLGEQGASVLGGGLTTDQALSQAGGDIAGGAEKAALGAVQKVAAGGDIAGNEAGAMAGQVAGQALGTAFGGPLGGAVGGALGSAAGDALGGAVLGQRQESVDFFYNGSDCVGKRKGPFWK
jgi:chemotaxis protein histidine kinase CheA